jgi:hypothetical protein
MNQLQPPLNQFHPLNKILHLFSKTNVFVLFGEEGEINSSQYYPSEADTFELRFVSTNKSILNLPQVIVFHLN